MAETLPEDLLITILTKLPVQSLLRFRAVSKSFKSLISSPHFISSHLSSRHPHTVLVRLYHPSHHTFSYKLCLDNPSLHKLTDLPSPQNAFFTLIGCVNGLLCLSDDKSDHLLLWNPVLRLSLPLPPPSLPATDSVVLGFGPSSADHKLLRIAYSPSASAQIYSLREGRWRAIPVPPSPLPLIRGRQASVGGSLHWLAENGAIVRFNLESEEFDTRIALPAELRSGRAGNLTIAAWGEALAVFRVQYMGGFCMWAMAGDGGWSKRFAVESVGVLRRVRSLRRSGEVVFEVSGDKLVVFDPNTNRIGECGFEVEGALSAFHMRSYSESLLLLDHKDAVSC